MFSWFQFNVFECKSCRNALRFHAEWGAWKSNPKTKHPKTRKKPLHFLEYLWTSAVMSFLKLKMRSFQPWNLWLVNWLEICSGYYKTSDWKLLKIWYSGILQTISSPQKHCKMKLLFCSYLFIYLCTKDLIPFLPHFTFLLTFVTLVLLTRILLVLRLYKD